MKRTLAILAMLALVFSLVLWACDSDDGTTPGDGDSDECPTGQIMGPDGNCHSMIPDGDEPVDGDDSDGDVVPDGDKPDGDTPDGDVTDGDNVDGDIDGDQIDGDVVDGDQIDGDVIDGDQIDGDVVDGDQIDGDGVDGDQIDGDVVDGDTVDGDVVDGDQIDGDVTDGDVIDGDLGDCGGACSTDDNCNPGCYCSNENTCIQDCGQGTEFVCGSLCCNYERGRCEACVDGDVVDGDDETVLCPNGNGDCPDWHFCNGLHVCQSDCDPENPCSQTDFYCSDLGQCLPIPDDDGEADDAFKRLLKNCTTNADCPAGDICDWNRKVCVAGCKLNADCPPEAPSCAAGICF